MNDDKPIPALAEFRAHGSKPLRNAKGQLLPGQTANRSGRPKMFATVAREIARLTDDGVKLVAWVHDIWTSGPEKGYSVADKRWALEWLADRGMGKPVLAIELQAHVSAMLGEEEGDTGPDFTRLTDEALDALEDALDVEAVEVPRPSEALVADVASGALGVPTTGGDE